MEGCRCMSCWSRGPVPRMSDDAGLWFFKKHSTMEPLFAGTPFSGDRWYYEMTNLPSARKTKKTIRLTTKITGEAVWLGADAFEDAPDG
jgi:hypothetical protein